MEKNQRLNNRRLESKVGEHHFRGSSIQIAQRYEQLAAQEPDKEHFWLQYAEHYRKIANGSVEPTGPIRP